MSSANQPPNKKKKKSHIEGQGMFSFGNGSEVTFTRLQTDSSEARNKKSGTEGESDRKFQAKWKLEHHWLRFDEKKMLCSAVCVKMQTVKTPLCLIFVLK